MQLLETIADLRRACDRARLQGGRVGLVPTMGSLHDGHRSLMRAAREACDLVVVTIFVNPLQFGAGEDLDTYPRDLSGDTTVCERESVDLVFAPSVAEMYPSGQPLTTVHVSGVTDDLCGASRPTHFDGVATVVAKLFAATGPCRAYFGRKDAQQLAVITRMATDLDLPVDVIGCPIVRESDGLALSSRNAYLSTAERRSALVLSRALERAAAAVSTGERDSAALVDLVRGVVARKTAVELEYAEVRRFPDLARVDRLEGEILVALAARVGTTRLIDNITLSIRGADVTADLGTHATPSRSKEWA
jgi:pantoate--beta-alanine ligase